MAEGPEKDAFGRLRSFVATEAHPRQRDQFAHILLGHQEVNRTDARFILDEEIDERLHRILTALGGDLRQRFALEWLELFFLEADQQDVLGGAGPDVEILPTRILFANFAADARSEVGVAQPASL